MAPLVFMKIYYILSLLVSFSLVCQCHLYSDSQESDRETCDTKGEGCTLRNRPRDTEDVDGPTIIGRDGLTRLDGIKVRSKSEFFLSGCFNSHNSQYL